MKIQAGTSGYSYKEWKGAFYPEDLPAGDMLGYYAGRLPTVEINNTFYRMPTEKLLASWAEQVPEGFRFVLKAPQRITHKKKLEDAGEETEHFFRMAGTLEARLGAVLFQLPPWLRKDVPRLMAFLEILPRVARAAFEFRHASWFDDEVFDRLRERGAALCVADAEGDLDTPLAATAPWGYLRLRRTDYDDAALADWANRVQAQPWEEAFVFFKHEDEATGPRLAERFLELARRV
ncbi:MAG: DUF72 domain-containing protein [Gemmatimonadetes bacterium]|nr:DUF72 domain-containing protein [Gemmatimonadota bacterium]